jgi:hypothetical protein
MTSVPMILVCTRRFQSDDPGSYLRDLLHTKRYVALSKSSLTSAICRRRVGDVDSGLPGLIFDDMSCFIGFGLVRAKALIVLL